MKSCCQDDSYYSQVAGLHGTSPAPQNERGNVHHPAWVRENTRRICRNLGLPRITAHGLRGTHASLARGAGVTGHMVSQQLGHASYQVTQDHYLADGIDAEQERKAALRVLEGGKPS